MKMKNEIQVIRRFVEIDQQYFSTSIPISQKIQDICRTNFRLLYNLLRKSKAFRPVKIGNATLYYDTPYATKTLLTTIYDFYTEIVLTDILSERPVVVDIGANIGQFAVATKQFFPRAKIYSFEPDKDVFKILKRNVANFSDVKAQNVGLSNTNKTATFYKNQNFSEWSSLIPMKGYSYTRTQAVLKKGDTVLKTFEKINLLKIDVEGAELQVIEGMQKTLPNCEYVLIEASILRNPDDFGSTAVLQALFDHHFYIYHIGRIFSSGKGGKQGAIDILLKNKNL